MTATANKTNGTTDEAAALLKANAQLAIDAINEAKKIAAEDQARAAELEAAATKHNEEHPDTPTDVEANPFQKRLVISLNHANANTRSVTRSVEEWLLTIEALEELGRNVAFNAAYPVEAKAARRLTMLHYVNDGIPSENRRALNNRLNAMIEEITKSGARIPNQLALGWNTDPKDRYYDNNRSEYQVSMKATELYLKYADDPTDEKQSAQDAPGDQTTLDANQFEIRKTELDDPKLIELREGDEGPSTVS